MTDPFVVPNPPTRGLNHLFIVGLKPRPDGQFYEVADSGQTAYLRIRVTRKAKKFYMSARWQRGATSATSRMLGIFWDNEDEDSLPLPGYLTLGQARDKAREWEKMRSADIDPRQFEREQSEAAARANLDTAASDTKRDFEALAEAYFDRPEFQKQRQRKGSERSIRYDLLNPVRNPWMNKNVSEIDDEDIAEVISAIAGRGAPNQAHHIFGHAKQIFNYGMRPGIRKKFQLKANPIAHLRARDLDLQKAERHVVRIHPSRAAGF